MIAVKHTNANIIVGIDSNIDIKALVSSFFSFFSIYHPVSKKECDYFYTIELNNNGAQLENGTETIVFGCVEEALLFISDNLHLHVKGYGAYYHGAVSLNKKSRAIAFIGETMSGKTSLNMLLYKYGYKFLSDDAVIVNEQLKIIPLPTVVKIRRGIIWNDPYYNKYCVFTNNDYKVLSLSKGDITDKEFEIDAFVFIHRGNFNLSLIEMTTSEFLYELLINSSQFDFMQKQTFTSTTLIKSVKGYNLYYNKLDDGLFKLIENI